MYDQVMLIIPTIDEDTNFQLSMNNNYLLTKLDGHVGIRLFSTWLVQVDPASFHQKQKTQIIQQPLEENTTTIY